jgi:hypothetical protein
MPYCPKCHCDYQPGATRCPDCGARLLPHPPPTPDTGSADPQTRDQAGAEPVELCRVADPSEAEIVHAVLAGAGIVSLVRTHGALTGTLATVVDGATSDFAIIYVPSNRLEEAKRLLEEMRAKPPAWPEGMEPDLESEGDDS